MSRIIGLIIGLIFLLILMGLLTNNTGGVIMKNITVVDKISEKRATKIFNTLCKYTNPLNECVLPYMGGNKFEPDSFSVGVEVNCANRITERVLYSINIVKKHLILGNILK